MPAEEPSPERQEGNPPPDSLTCPAQNSGHRILDLLHESDPFVRVQALARTLSTRGPDALTEVREALDHPGVDRDAADLLLLVRFWSEHDPRAAARWSAANAPPAYRAALILASVEEWASADPDAARRFIEANLTLPGPQREAAQMALIRGWFDSGYGGLERFLEDLGPGFERQRALGVFARRMVQRSDSIVALNWASTLPDRAGRFKLDAIRQLGSELAKIDPAAATRLCDAHCDGPYGSGLRHMVAARWVGLDAPAAMDWLAEAPPGRERDRAVRAAYQIWMRRDREEATRWATAATAKENSADWLAPALDLHAVAIAADRPHEALAVVHRVPDEDRRRSALIAIAQCWRERDPEAANAWLETAPLSDEAREQARTNPEGRALCFGIRGAESS